MDIQVHGWAKSSTCEFPAISLQELDGNDVPECWTTKYNIPGKEAHTPGNYACLNLNKFTSELEGRESTKMPNRMFVTVNYQGNGYDQPD